MCGLVGIASKNHQENKYWLEKANKELIHRGPDSSGIWWSQNQKVGLAHRRLAIQDLSISGNQPMHFYDRKISIVFNGEIYNFKELRKELEILGHKFKSKTDTEVLLKAYTVWGKEMVKNLNGMFVFAIYDEIQNIIFIARDRSGEKPLYYYHEKDTIYFASELKALFSNKKLIKKIDYKYLDSYLSMGFVSGANTLISNFKKLPPANTLTFSILNGSIEVSPYWSLPKYSNRKVSLKNEEDLLLKLEDLLFSSVSKQLVADVPVGILLSGGLDSSMITALAVRSNTNIKTFNISFPGEKQYNESNHAKLIAKFFNTEHTELELSPASASLIPSLARQFDEPIVDSSMIPTSLLSNLVRKHCKVALGGDGADELFGGYEHYQRLLILKRYSSKIPNFALSLLGKFSEYFISPYQKGKNYLNFINYDLNKDVPLIAQYFEKQSREDIMGSSEYSFESEIERNLLISKSNDLLDRALRFDFIGYLAEDILVKIDRASMMHSLELRAPFLDHQLIEFAFNLIPSNLKASHKNKKILLKRLAKKILPSNFDFNRKKGFSIPLNTWLKGGEFKELFWDTLQSHDCLFNRSAIKDILKRQEKFNNLGEKLFALVFFELWRKSYNI